MTIAVNTNLTFENCTNFSNEMRIFSKFFTFFAISAIPTSEVARRMQKYVFGTYMLY